MKILLFIILAASFSSCEKRTPFLDKRLKTYKYPYKTKIYNYLSQTQKVSMDYLVKEDKKIDYKEGKTVLFLHDINTVGAQWKGLADLFYKAGYRILIPDLIGMGRSLKPQGYQYSTNAYAFMLKKFIYWYKLKKPMLIGSGFGSDIIQTYSNMDDANYSKNFLINPTFFIGESVSSNYMSIDQLYQKELNKDLKAIKGFISTKVDISQPEGAHLLWLHTGLIQGIDWRELAFTRAKIMHHYVYSKKSIQELAKNTFIIYGDKASYWPASYLKQNDNYIQKLKKSYPQAIKIEDASSYPEISTPEQVFKEIRRH